MVGVGLPLKKWVVYSLTIFIYNLFILILPLLIFLLDLSFSHGRIINTFLYLFLPFLLFSPVLAVGLSSRIALNRDSGANWLYPVFINAVGFSPFWLVYLSLSSLWSPRDYFLIISIPIILGIFSAGLANFSRFCSRRTPLV
jgi:hypothetical protein